MNDELIPQLADSLKEGSAIPRIAKCHPQAVIEALHR